jgi:hypothetical protein
MSVQRLSYRKWRQPLGEVMPIAFVPQVMNVSRDEVAGAVARGELPVFTFRGDDGRVFRMVRISDVQRFNRNPLTMTGMVRALDRLMRQPSAPATPGGPASSADGGRGRMARQIPGGRTALGVPSRRKAA